MKWLRKYEFTEAGQSSQVERESAESWSYGWETRNS